MNRMHWMMGIGVLALLIAIGVLTYIWTDWTHDVVAPQGKVARSSGLRLTGRGADGKPATDSIGVKTSTDPEGLMVVSLVSGGSYDDAYGIKVGDLITALGEAKVETMGGPDVAKEGLLLNYQEGKSLTVVRAGQEMELNFRE